MDFRIADTFTDGLSKLTGEEQKVVKTTAFDLQLNSASPGMQLRSSSGLRQAWRDPFAHAPRATTAAPAALHPGYRVAG